MTDYGDLGVRIEADQVDGHLLIGLRPLDWRYRIGNHLAFSLFGGIARYNVETPATSMYAGLGAQWMNIIKSWDLNLDFRYAQNVARDHVLASDPPGVRPDTFYKIESLVFYISKHF